MKEVIEFKKQRDVGAIITDVFKFVRQEGKELGLIVLKVTGPAMLVMIASYVFYAQSTMGDIERIFQSTSVASNAIISSLLLLASYIIFYALLYGCVFGYIKNYIENNGQVDAIVVTQLARKHFWSYLGLNVLVGLITVVGLVLCILPGIYFGVCLTLTYPILMLERNDIGTAFSNSFKLIKDEWWITFATLIVVYVLYYMIVLIFQIPQIIYMFSKVFAMRNEISGNPFEMVDWVSITFDVIGMIAQYLLFGLIIIALAFIYYNLNERKNFTGTLESIEKIGERENRN